MIRLLLSTLRLTARWGFFWLRSRTALYLMTLARYKVMTALKAR